MPPNVEEYLKELVEGQKRQAERDGVVLSEVAEIRKTVERLHERLDDIHETTVIHGEKIKSLRTQQCKQDENCKSQHELIWLKIRERKEEAIEAAKEKIDIAVQKLKIWILAGVLSGVVSIGIALFTTFFKKEGGP